MAGGSIVGVLGNQGGMFKPNGKGKEITIEQIQLQTKIHHASCADTSEHVWIIIFVNSLVALHSALISLGFGPNAADPSNASAGFTVFPKHSARPMGSNWFGEVCIAQRRSKTLQVYTGLNIAFGACANTVTFHSDLYS